MIKLDDDGVLEIKGERKQLLVEFGGIVAGLIHGKPNFELDEILMMIGIVAKQTKKDFKKAVKEVKE